jgi:hypothetical protein
MNIQTAQTIVTHVANIARIASTFHAKFGRDYRLQADSPAQAWELYRQVMAEQATIASLLEAEALNSPYSRYGKWWERRDIIDTGILNQLEEDAMNLVERTAYLQAMEQSTQGAPALLVLQQSIAGILHPATRQTSLEHTNNALPKAV